ncbi:hypothetical protein [Blastococcus sp. SYSU D00820]
MAGAGRRVVLVLVAAVLALAGCGDDGAAGTYVHDVEGTITLAEDGSATWEQEGNSAAFEWEQEGDTITFLLDGEAEGEARLEDGDLVLAPDLISGDEDVVFERQ